MVAAHRDAGRMDLSETRIPKSCPSFVRPEGCGHIAAPRVGGEEKSVSVSAGGEHHGRTGMRRDLTTDQVAHDYSLGPAINDDEIQHFSARIHFHLAQSDLAAQCLIGSQQKLLAGLAPGVKRARDLGAAKGTV